MKAFKKDKKFFLISFILIFLGAFLLRGFLINWTLNLGYNGDFVRYEDWARISHIYGFADTYTTRHLTVSQSFPNNQPPGSLYIVSAAFESWILIGKILLHLTHVSMGSNIWVNTHLQHILMKIPPLLSDLLMGFVVYLLVKKEAGEKRGLFAASLVLFTPITFYNSAIWGQMDSLNNVFFLLALFFAYKKHTILSLLAYTASLFIKLSLLPLAPFYFVFLFFMSERNIKRILIGVFFCVCAYIVGTLPISSSPILWLIREFPLIAHGEYQNISVAAFNFWWAVTCLPMICHAPPVVGSLFLGIPLRIWAYSLFGFFTLPILYGQIKYPKEFITKYTFFLVLALVALLAYLFLPNMHDRYMYPVFPLLAVVVGLSKQMRVYFISFLCLTVLHLINLIYSWYPAQFPFFVLYQILYNSFFTWFVSISTVVAGGWLYWKFFTELRRNHVIS